MLAGVLLMLGLAVAVPWLRGVMALAWPDTTALLGLLAMLLATALWLGLMRRWPRPRVAHRSG